MKYLLYHITMMKYIIYAIYNKITDKYYIGSSSEKWIKVRKNNHFSQLKRGIHHSYKLQSSWKKHGEQAFTFQILEENINTPENRRNRETFWITKFNSYKKGYNCTKEAQGLHKEFSTETRKKMSENRIRLIQEGKFKNPNPKGEKRDKELMQYINSKKGIPILQYNMDNEFIQEFNSIQDARRTLNISRTGINNCLSLKNKAVSAGGYKWKYKHCKDIV